MATILVVEDEAVIRTLLCDLLHDEGYATIAAAEGQAALAILQQQMCDLIICDLMMPRMGGLEFIAHLPAQHTIPLILISASTPLVLPDLPPDTVFMAKPFNIPTLLTLIHEQLAPTRSVVRTASSLGARDNLASDRET